MKKKGFTLVELLVVIGIIALLISILLPALNKARQQASSVSCLSNLHNMANAMNMYLGQNKGIFPFAEGASDSQNNLIHWGALLSQVMGIGDGTIASAGNSYTDARRKMFICPDGIIYNGDLPLNDYSCHPLLMPNISLNYPNITSVWGSLANQPRKPYHVSRITNSADIALAWDAVQCSTDSSSAPESYALDQQRITNVNNPPATFLLIGYCQRTGVDMGKSVDGGPNHDDSTESTTDNIYGNIRWRHLGNTAANFLFVDGHAATLRYNSETNTGLLRRNICVALP